MAYADTASVLVTSAWTLIGTSPLRFTNTTGLGMQVFRKATAPASTAAGAPLDPGRAYENSNSGETVYARLMAGPASAAPSASVVVDAW